MVVLRRVLAGFWAGSVRLFRYWKRDVQSRKTTGGKLASLLIGVLVICCVAGAIQTAVRGAGEAVGLVPTRTPTSAPHPTTVEVVKVEPTAQLARPIPTEPMPLTPIRLVTTQANAQIIDEGALRAAPKLTGDRLGTVCPGDTVAVLERGTIWHRIQVVTIGADCNPQHAGPGAEGWVAFQNVQLPTPTPAPTAAKTTQPTEILVSTIIPQPSILPEPTIVRPTVPIPTRNPLNTGGADLYSCDDFATWNEANAIYQANLPGDPNRLDTDDDGIPCENKPGAPG